MVVQVRIGAVIDGRVHRRRVYRGLLDTGTSQSVIPFCVADDLNLRVDPAGASCEGAERDGAFAAVRVMAVDCVEKRMLVIVDDELAERAGYGIDMIIGHDYMQRTNLALLRRPRTRRRRMSTRRGGRRSITPTRELDSTTSVVSVADAAVDCGAGARYTRVRTTSV